MPTYVFQDSDNIDYTQIEEGDYPFEILQAVEGVQKDGKTKGAEVLNITVGIYEKPDFKTLLTKWKEKLIFDPTCLWKIDTFGKCTREESQWPKKGQNFTLTQYNVVGLRGICKVGVKEGIRDATKKFNYVVLWYTDQPKFQRNVIDPADIPSDEDNEPDPW